MAVERPKVMKENLSRVYVITENYKFLGDLHLVNLDRRETDILNDDKPFIHLTNVDVRTAGESGHSKVPFVAVNKSSIICVIPLEDGSTQGS